MQNSTLWSFRGVNTGICSERPFLLYDNRKTKHKHSHSSAKEAKLFIFLCKKETKKEKNRVNLYKLVSRRNNSALDETVQTM